MNDSQNSPTRPTPSASAWNPDNGPAAASDTKTQEAEQNRKTLELLSEDPIFIPDDDSQFDEDDDSRGDFWLSWLAHAAWMIPALLFARWFLIAFVGGHAPDYDFVMRVIHHAGL